MKFLLMLRKTHEAELDKAINIITEKNRIIAVKKDELEVEKRTKARLQDRNESLHQALTIAEGKLKKLEEYVEKLEQVSGNILIRNTSLNSRLMMKDVELKDKIKENEDLDKANKVLIDGFNSANRSNWCNEESKRQLIKLAEDMLEADNINKNEVASYLLKITKYMGGGMPIEIKINEDFEM